MRVEVTEEDIRAGEIKENGSCVIERAVARAYGVEPRMATWGFQNGNVRTSRGTKHLGVASADRPLVLAAIRQNDQLSPSKRTTEPFVFELTENIF